jgi:aryl-alcohol dehydrogenase-like predicted oxidoreductase
MRYRTLGSSGIRVSEIGFGTWGLGGNAHGAVAYGATSDAESIAALRAACDRGVNFFDTSDFYGFGHSERVLGEALRGMRDRVFIATKAGLLDASGTHDFSPAHLRGALEASLARLGTDYVDLFQLHSPPIELLERQPEVIGCLEDLRRAGKLRAYGASVRSPDEGLVAVERLGLRCIQANFSLLDQRALENGLLERCERLGAGLIGRTPLSFGFLTGQYSAATKFDPHDHRNRWSAEQRERWANALGKFIAALRSRSSHTPAQLALRFCLSFAAVSTVIPGMLTEAHVAENTAASDLGPLDDADLAALVNVYREQAFFVERISSVS